MQHCKQFGSFIAPAAILISSIHFPSWIISTTITTESLDQSYVSMTLTSNYVLHHVTNENCCSPNIIGTFLMAAVKFISTSTKGSAPWTALVWSQQTIRSMILHLQNYIPVKSNICVETCNASDRTLCRPTNEQCKKPTYTYLYTIYWNSTENNSFDFFEIIFFEIIFFLKLFFWNYVFWNYFFYRCSTISWIFDSWNKQVNPVLESRKWEAGNTISPTYKTNLSFLHDIWWWQDSFN